MCLGDDVKQEVSRPVRCYLLRGCGFQVSGMVTGLWEEFAGLYLRKLDKN